MVWVAGRASGLEPHRPVKPDKHNALKAIWAGPVRIVANGLRVRVPPARSCGQWRWRDGLATLPPGVNSTIRLVPESAPAKANAHPVATSPACGRASLTPLALTRRLRLPASLEGLGVGICQEHDWHA